MSQDTDEGVASPIAEGPGAPRQTTPHPSGIPENERLLAGLCHFAPWFGLPVIGPILLWAAKKDQSSFVAHHAIQSAAWQAVTLVLFTMASMVLTFISFITCGAGSLLFLFLVPLALATALYDAYHGYLAWLGQRSEFVGLEGIDKRLGLEADTGGA